MDLPPITFWQANRRLLLSFHPAIKISNKKNVRNPRFSRNWKENLVPYSFTVTIAFRRRNKIQPDLQLFYYNCFTQILGLSYWVYQIILGFTVVIRNERLAAEISRELLTIDRRVSLETSYIINLPNNCKKNNCTNINIRNMSLNATPVLLNQL